MKRKGSKPTRRLNKKTLQDAEKGPTWGLISRKTALGDGKRIRQESSNKDCSMAVLLQAQRRGEMGRPRFRAGEDEQKTSPGSRDLRKGESKRGG